MTGLCHVVEVMGHVGGEGSEVEIGAASEVTICFTLSSVYNRLILCIIVNTIIVMLGSHCI